MEKPNIRYADKQILVAVKEAGMAVQSAAIGQPDMDSRIRTWLLGTTTERVPYLGIVHRLDQPVEGLVVFGRTKEAAADLSRQLTEHRMGKEYLAVVEKELPVGEKQTFTDYLKKERQQAMVSTAKDPAAKRAVLDCQVVASSAGRSLLQIRLETGRFHQIRCQLSHRGMPIAGDVRYGGSRQLQPKNIALCAWMLTFAHPKTGKKMCFVQRPSQEAFSCFAQEIDGLCKTMLTDPIKGV